MELALELGFEGILYSHDPSGGAPEELIGQPAPNFALLTLDGKVLELHESIRGRPGSAGDVLGRRVWTLLCRSPRFDSPL